MLVKATQQFNVRGWCDADHIEVHQLNDRWYWVLVDFSGMAVASSSDDEGFDMELEAIQDAVNSVLDREWLAERGL